MTFHSIYVSDNLIRSLSDLIGQSKTLSEANLLIAKFCGIEQFFEQKDEMEEFLIFAKNKHDIASDVDRAEYGDFQTNFKLATQVCELLKNRGLQPEIVIEPTFGKGNFVLAALEVFENIDTIIGIEIYKPYLWQTKFSIVDFFTKNSGKKRPSIHLYHQNVFDFDFHKIQTFGKELLVLGNPPWVTNATLSLLDSNNLPNKSNFKKHNGLDAITGKGNFDIAEYISIMLFKAFHQQTGHIAFLVKNSVIKNLIFDQKQKKYKLSNIEKFSIDALKEFGAAVDASLFFAKFGANTHLQCTDFDRLYPIDKEAKNKFGWVGEKFVSDIKAYYDSAQLDGKCPFEWRQGIKHDCSKIMELEQQGDKYINGLGEQMELEPDLVHGLLKSSDLKDQILRESRKSLIVTQTKVGQNTTHIRDHFPKTWDYLVKNEAAFTRRKSSIYNGKPPFSIFGIGEYSFAPFKVAISGLYKTWHFSLVYPHNGKPLMLDDTCYFLGFEREADAIITFTLLNTEKVKNLLQATVFQDSKRMITKEVLMRIDLKALGKFFDFETIELALNDFPALNINQQDWERYWELFAHLEPEQLTMF